MIKLYSNLKDFKAAILYLNYMESIPSIGDDSFWRTQAFEALFGNASEPIYFRSEVFEIFQSYMETNQIVSPHVGYLGVRSLTNNAWNSEVIQFWKTHKERTMNKLGKITDISELSAYPRVYEFLFKSAGINRDLNIMNDYMKELVDYKVPMSPSIMHSVVHALLSSKLLAPAGKCKLLVSMATK